jgi:hypothetical protein
MNNCIEYIWNVQITRMVCGSIYKQLTNSQLDKVMDTLYQTLNKKLDALRGHKPVNHNKETIKNTLHT